MVAPVTHGAPMAHVSPRVQGAPVEQGPAKAQGSEKAHGAHHPRHANFGALNSAVRHGDFEAAQKAYEALSTSSLPSAVAVRAKGSIDAIGAALASGDAASIRDAVAAFRSHRTLAEPAVEDPAPEAAIAETIAPEEPTTASPLDVLPDTADTAEAAGEDPADTTEVAGEIQVDAAEVAGEEPGEAPLNP